MTIFDVPTVARESVAAGDDVGSWSNKHYVGPDGCREEMGWGGEVAYQPLSSAIGIFLSRKKIKGKVAGLRASARRREKQGSY